ncbi:MAG TPA: hypothetical protein QGG18_07750, partial [Rhodospirillales bacterium]|nr:hypothetical protein [Rhodospirillales bacterium]
MPNLSLAHDLSFKDLYNNEGLAKVDHAFVKHLTEIDDDLSRRLISARAEPEGLIERETSDL